MDDKITLEEHRTLGNFLRIVSDKLTKISIQIRPKALAKKSKEARALKLANELRNVLEDIMLKDYDLSPSQNLWQDIYYGNAGRRK